MKKFYNTLVIGSGCAGYNAADRLYDFGVTDTAIITEGRMMGTSRNTGSDKQTYYKLSLCGGDGDSVRELANTLFSGGGVNGDNALVEAAYSARCFFRLVELGVPFPANEYGEYVGYRTDHDPRQRATSCGPLTSKLMTEALEKSVLSKGIEIIDGYQVIKILSSDGCVTGIAALPVGGGDVAVIGCENVILATGGPAGIYYNTVYPESQTGGTGLALEAGARASNLEEWQYGLASIKFRWNVSGTYQQVIPRYISVDEENHEHEFLYEALGEKSLDMVFLKGYQWPFDTRKIDGSSQVDLLVNTEIQKGRRVYMDFTKNPIGLENGFGSLSHEAYEYLEKSDALFGKPIERLEKMNSKAVGLYASHGINLFVEPLEIAVCAQHCNGGVAVDADWQSNIKGLYAAGEAAGTFGVYRPGGAALNSTQVGSLRAAEHIAGNFRNTKKTTPEFKMPSVRYGKSNIREILLNIQKGMSECAAFVRDTGKLKEFSGKVCRLYDNFFDTAVISDAKELPGLFKLYDLMATARAVLSAMILSAEKDGTHGSALVDSLKGHEKGRCSTVTITCGSDSCTEPVRPIPDAELWFEKVWNRKK